MMADHVVGFPIRYGWSERGLSGRAGEQFIVIADGLSDRRVWVEQKVAPYLRGAVGDGMGVADVDGLGLVYRRLDTGTDHVGRSGAFLTTALLFTDGIPFEMLPALPRVFEHFPPEGRFSGASISIDRAVPPIQRDQDDVEPIAVALSHLAAGQQAQPTAEDLAEGWRLLCLLMEVLPRARNVVAGVFETPPLDRPPRIKVRRDPTDPPSPGWKRAAEILLGAASEDACQRVLAQFADQQDNWSAYATALGGWAHLELTAAEGRHLDERQRAFLGEEPAQRLGTLAARGAWRPALDLAEPGSAAEHEVLRFAPAPDAEAVRLTRRLDGLPLEQKLDEIARSRPPSEVTSQAVSAAFSQASAAEITGLSKSRRRAELEASPPRLSRSHLEKLEQASEDIAGDALLQGRTASPLERRLIKLHLTGISGETWWAALAHNPMPPETLEVLQDRDVVAAIRRATDGVQPEAGQPGKVVASIVSLRNRLAEDTTDALLEMAFLRVPGSALASSLDSAARAGLSVPPSALKRFLAEVEKGLLAERRLVRSRRLTEALSQLQRVAEDPRDLPVRDRARRLLGALLVVDDIAEKGNVIEHPVRKSALAVIDEVDEPALRSRLRHELERYAVPPHVHSSERHPAGAQDDPHAMSEAAGTGAPVEEGSRASARPSRSPVPRQAKPSRSARLRWRRRSPQLTPHFGKEGAGLEEDEPSHETPLEEKARSVTKALTIALLLCGALVAIVASVLLRDEAHKSSISDKGAAEVAAAWAWVPILDSRYSVADLPPSDQTRVIGLDAKRIRVAAVDRVSRLRMTRPRTVSADGTYSFRVAGRGSPGPFIARVVSLPGVRRIQVLAVRPDDGRFGFDIGFGPAPALVVASIRPAPATPNQAAASAESVPATSPSP